MADADKCVMCGEVIPESTWVCPKCVINPPSSIPLYAIKCKKTGRYLVIMTALSCSQATTCWVN